MKCMISHTPESITNQANLNMCDNMNILSKCHQYTAK